MRARALGSGSGLRIGAQANCWTQTMDTVRRVDHMIVPQLAAFAAVS
jgi:N-acetyl-beta-hexosaminidase